MKEPKLKIIDEEKCEIVLGEGATLPFYATYGDAGMDICAAETVIIAPQDKAIVKTNIKISLPDEDMVIDVRPRSGLSAKVSMEISNAPGTIDYGYMSDIGIIIKNTSLPFHTSIEGDEVKLTPVKPEDVTDISDKDFKNRDAYIRINKGDRIAQLVFARIVRVQLVEKDELTPKVDRGGGFGSSGI